MIAGSVSLVAAIVTAVSTATNVLLKDRLDRRIESARTTGAQRETYRKYADPLTSAAESLYWRLREIFELGRGNYLATGGGINRYELYKVVSTRYRLAALLGWITALRKELVLCDVQPDESVSPLRSAVAAVEESLAEGAHVEDERARRLCQLWNVAPTSSDGARIDMILKRRLHAQAVERVSALEASDRSALVVELAAALSERTPGGISDAVLRNTEDEAIKALSTREAWIYRDWQQAIGETMLVESTGGVRRFEVAGFRMFDEKMRSTVYVDREWLGRIAELTDELDVTIDPATDARILQLEGVYRAVARLLDEFHKCEPRRSSLSPATLAAVAVTLSGA